MMLHSSMRESCSEVNIASSENQLDSSNSNEFKLSMCGQGGHEIDVSREECERKAISEVEDADIEMQFCCSEGLSDENDCMWLSSNSMPASIQSSDNLQSLDILELDFCDVLLYYQFSAMPPMFTGNGAFFDLHQGGFVSENPIEASLILENMQSGAGEGPKGDTFGYNGIKHSSMWNSEEVESVYRCSLSEYSSDVNSSCSAPSTHDVYSPLDDHDLNIINIWLPLLDLEGEESKWDANGFDVLDQDFPSPSCHTEMNLQTRSSCYSYNQTSRQPSDTQALLGTPNSLFNPLQKHVLDVKSLPRDSDADEPLFWPFDQKSYWSTELEGNYLGISPLEDILNIKRPVGCHASKSVQFRLDQRNNSSLHRKSIQQGHKGRIAFSSISAQLLLAQGKSSSRDSSSNSSQNTGLPPARSRSIRLPSEKAAFCPSKKKGVKGQHQSSPLRNRSRTNQKTSLDQYLLEFEADDFKIYVTGGFPIEALVGLDEFDGHEGIGTMETGWGMEEINEDPLL